MLSQDLRPYNLDNLALDFNKYLSLISNLSKPTARSYRSDVLHFINWLKHHLGVYEIPRGDIITKECFNDYIDFLATSDSPVLSTNRKLSALRHFFDFCTSQELVSENYARGVNNFRKSDRDLDIAFTKDAGFSAEERDDIDEFLRIVS